MGWGYWTHCLRIKCEVQKVVLRKGFVVVRKYREVVCQRKGMRGGRKLTVKSIQLSKYHVGSWKCMCSDQPRLFYQVWQYLLVLDVVEGRYVCSQLPRWSMPKTIFFKVTQWMGEHEWKTHFLRCNPCSCSCIPFCDKKTQGVASSKGHAGQKSPLFTDKPLIVFNVVRISQERVEG